MYRIVREAMLNIIQQNAFDELQKLVFVLIYSILCTFVIYMRLTAVLGVGSVINNIKLEPPMHDASFNRITGNVGFISAKNFVRNGIAGSCSWINLVCRCQKDRTSAYI
jgi:hypothetical protein